MIKEKLIIGIVLANIENLQYYSDRRDEYSDSEICKYVIDNIEHLQWYFSIPISIYMYPLIFICYAYTGKSLDVLSQPHRLKVFYLIKKFPFFSLINKYIRNYALLKLFDLFPVELTPIKESE